MYTEALQQLYYLELPEVGIARAPSPELIILTGIFWRLLSP